MFDLLEMALLVGRLFRTAQIYFNQVEHEHLHAGIARENCMMGNYN